ACGRSPRCACAPTRGSSTSTTTSESAGLFVVTKRPRRPCESDVMDFGAHLPLMDFGGNPYTLEHLTAYTDTAARLGFSALSANDHMVFSVPWLDGPTALAAMIGSSGPMTLATTVALPVIRGPVPLAKTLAAIDRLSQGRLGVAVGPG